MGNIDVEVLKRKLWERGLSARSASINAGLPDNFVGRLLSGEKADPGTSKIIALCDVLGVKDVRELYDGTEEGGGDG